MKNYIHKIHYSEDLRLKDRLFIAVLWFCSLFYGIAVSIRNFLYKINILNSAKLNAYTISIGNLTTGGTGKTPITCEIANYINKELSKKVAIISRGYGGQLSNKNTNIISDGSRIFYDSIRAGDEPFWMAVNTKNTAVITGKNRVKSGQYAIDNFNSEVLILDDGFQHLKLKRDLDIVLIDCIKVFGNRFLLPAGPLREPENQLKRADKVIIVNKIPFEESAKQKCKKLQENLSAKYNKNIIFCNIYPDKIYDLKTNEEVIPQKSLAFAGIGQPGFFFNSLKNKGIELVSEMVFEDHYLYTRTDMEKLIEKAQNSNADSIITTEKDAVKLADFLDEINSGIKICALKLKVELELKDLLS